MSKELYLFANWKMYLDYQESFVLAQELEKKCADLSENIHMTVFPSTLAFAPISAMLNSKTSPASIVTGTQNIC
jgi:triosephosphate isomerase